ncbi:MAG: 4-(cytidine 5'-diphospho)-2-C-methyl-D-erythritol kinase, partial [Muribaculaceae bacterium]|nr:4-(cytidine 5'-diphospho)-2-C-methyl-D-erythritol kinase [Muribaculaceae bacterium]
LLQAGAHYAAMSGSGSTIYGIFDDAKVAEQVSAKFADCATFVLSL